MRTWILGGLAVAVLGLVALPGEGAAQLFNSSKKESTEEAPPANTAKGGSSGGTSLFNSGSNKAAPKPLFLDPSTGNKNSGGKAKPFTKMQSTTAKLNNGFNNGAPKSATTTQDELIRRSAAERLSRAAARRGQVEANLAKMKAEADAADAAILAQGQQYGGQNGVVMPTAEAVTPPAPVVPDGPMVYEGAKQSGKDQPRRLFNSSAP